MDINSVAILLVLIGQIQSFSSRRLCDVRIWYLNLVANDVFNMELNQRQTDLKNNIETLILNSSDKPESRVKECHVLEMYNDMLKDSLGFDYSTAQNMRNYIVSEDQDTRAYTDKITENISVKNTDKNSEEIQRENNEIKKITEESENRDSIKDVESSFDNNDSVKDIKKDQGKEQVSSDNKILENSDSDKTTGNEHARVETQLNENGLIKHSVYTLDEEVISNINEFSHEHDEEQADDVDETEIFDEEDELELLEDDSFIVQNKDEIHHFQNVDITANEAKRNATKIKPIPFGICWAFGCVRSEIFGLKGNETLHQEDTNKGKLKDDNNTEKILTITMCYNKDVCTKLCYYITFKLFCFLDYENITEKNEKICESEINDLSKDVHIDSLDNKENKNYIVGNKESDVLKIKEMTEHDLPQNSLANSDKKENNPIEADINLHLSKETNEVNTKDNQETEAKIDKSKENIQVISDKNIVNQQKTIEEIEKEFMVYNEQPLESAKEESQMSLDDFEKLIQQKTSDYAHKIQSLELMIVNLEKQLLMEQLNKQNHTSFYTKLENLVLKLENDLLRMNRFYQNLKDETDAMNQKQNHYLELAYQQEKEKKYLELPDKSSKNFELITQHQSKIAELTDILKNQSNMITQMKTRHESLEEQNRMLHQMVMNQTIFMTSIIQTVQDLSEQNSKSKLEMLELKQKLDNVMKEKTIGSSEQTVTKEKITSTQTMIDTIDSYASDKKVHLKSLDDKSDIEINSNAKYMQETIQNWCPNDRNVCPACLYNSVMIKNCVPYQRAIWVPCEETCTISKTILPNSPDVGDSMTEEMLTVVESTKEDRTEEKQGSYNEINVDMAIIEDKHVGTKITVENDHVVQAKTNDESAKSQDATLNQDDKVDEVYVKNAPADLAGVQVEAKGNTQHTRQTESILKENKENLPEKKLVENKEFNEASTLNNRRETKQDDSKEEKEQTVNTNSKQDKISNIEIKETNYEENIEVKEPKEKTNTKLSEKKDIMENDKNDKREITKEVDNEQIRSDRKQEKVQIKEDKPVETNKEQHIINDEELRVDTKRDNGPTKQDKSSGKKAQTTKKNLKMEPIYIGREKQKEPKDCYEIYRRGSKGDGIYKIRPLGSKKVLEVFCDMKKGGWTVIQRRQDGSTNFFLGWDEYKKGFGGLYGEHWIGNDAIHYLTNQDYYRLRVDLIDWEKNKKYADFDYFLIENEDEGYRLHIDGYSGDAGDGLSKHNGHKFSTKDVDNDKVVKEFGGSCANRFHGAGWYYKCYASNLNGKYYKGGKIPEKLYDGVTWKPWTGPNYSIKKVVMKVRPASAQERT